jgi:hypothetical protein
MFAQGKSCEASRDSRYREEASPTSMLPGKQFDAAIIGNDVFCAVRVEM